MARETTPGAEQGSDRPTTWADTSLRTKLLLFALGLVTVPGAVFALIAFSGARAALEREVGIQLRETAERGADAITAAVHRATADANSWARQDIMRDLLVGDVDKRVSKFLATVINDKPAYLEVLTVDSRGNVTAASSRTWVGQRIDDWDALAATQGDGALLGPSPSSHFRREILYISVPVRNPDPPEQTIGSLVLIYDWRSIEGLLEDIRVKLTDLGKRVAAVIVSQGTVLGGVSFDGQPIRSSTLEGSQWNVMEADDGTHRIGGAGDEGTDVLVGSGAAELTSRSWSVLFLEPASEALAAVRTMRQWWTLLMLSILVAGLAVAALLARQFLRQLEEVTRATSLIAAHPDGDLPLLPVRSRNEVGQLSESFNRMTSALRQSQEEALSAAKFAFAGELAAMVAHEVRTPLSVMRSSAQMLADERRSPNVDRTELVETIVAEVDRVERVVGGLIQLARPIEQQLDAIRLRDVLSRAAAFVSAHARQQDVAIAFDFSELERPAIGDSEQLYQVVLNLIVNSLQAVRPGGQIWLRTTPPDATTVGFQVGDDGPGLPDSIRDRIFQPFVTGREGGTGLGLAFVERVIRAHHGRLSVRSEPGAGTIFEIRLPAAEVAA